MSDYRYSIAQCDVFGKVSLQTYRDKRATWTNWLNDDEHHAIWKTLTELVWNEVAFTTLARIAKADHDSALNNPLIAQALLNGHVAMQVLAIRRLTDTTSKVLSLSKLLQDIRKHRSLLTRENYVSFDGLPYDFQVAEEEHFRTSTTSPRWLDTAGSNAFHSSRPAHEQFGRLSGVSPHLRKRDDRIPAKLINTIERWITDCGAKEIEKWSHNYLAHAGSPSRRRAIAEYGVNGVKIANAIMGLAKAAEAISAYLIYSSGRLNALMAVPQLDQFERLENAALTAASEIDLSQLWDTLSNEFEESLDTVKEALISGISSGERSS